MSASARRLTVKEQSGMFRRTNNQPRAFKIVTAVRNRVLAKLPRRTYRRIERDLAPVKLRVGQVLHEPNEAISHVYFPDTCVISLLTLTEKGKALEVGLVGAEGLAGVSLALGVRRSP